MCFCLTEGQEEKTSYTKRKRKARIAGVKSRCQRLQREENSGIPSFFFNALFPSLERCND